MTALEYKSSIQSSLQTMAMNTLIDNLANASEEIETLKAKIAVLEKAAESPAASIPPA